MINREYRFKFYLNARHTMVIKGSSSGIHPHTWEFVLYVTKRSDNFIQFSDIEDDIEAHLSAFENKLLNELPPFTALIPSMENIGEVVYEQIYGILTGKGWDLNKLEISENPSRTYIISRLEKLADDTCMIGKLPHDAIEAPQADSSCCLETEKGTERISAASKVAISARRIADIALTIPEGEDLFSAAEKLAATAERLAHIEQLPEGNSLDIYEERGFNNEDCGNGDNYANAIDEAAAANEAVIDIKTGEDTCLEGEALSQASAGGDINVNETPGAAEKTGKRVRNTLLSMLAVCGASALLVLWLMHTGMYPWGSDSWYHLFKGHFLYNEIRAGDFFPLYTDQWYNGIQPMRYWAPLPHYVLSLIELLTGGNTALSYNLFIGLAFVTGAFGWILWGVKTGRGRLAFVLALLWFFLPDNLRVLFSEGNISRVAVTTIFPYLLLVIWNYFEKEDWKSVTAIAIIFMLITLCHAMIAAMAGITVFLYAVWYGAVNRKLQQAAYIVLSALVGIMMAGIWLYPALKGGMLSMDTEAVRDLMKGLTYSFTESLNPFLRLHNRDTFYFGASVLLASVVGLIYGSKESKAGFGVTILIFLGTTKALLPIVAKLPMSQLFWMMRFTPLAMGAFFTGIILWRNIKKGILYSMIILLIIDCSVSFSALAHNANPPEKLKRSLDLAVNYTTQRTALLDLSEFGSYPSFYISNNDKGKKVQQVFGSGWQGAKTSPNIVWINTALEKGLYLYVFDRCLELGADTVLVKRDLIRNEEEFLRQAASVGYEKMAETELAVILKYPVQYKFAVKARYSGLSIGKYAANLTFVFPEFQVGNSIYIDDYSEDELINYKVINLSGFKYHVKAKAEDMVKRLSEKGVRFVIDLTNSQEDIYTSRPGFLGVMAQPVEFKGAYPGFDIAGNKINVKTPMPEEYPIWRTVYLENLDEVNGTTEFYNHQMDFWGSKINDNIEFLGFNLPYFAVETKDQNVIALLEKATGMEAFQIPERKLVKLETYSDMNHLRLSAKEGGVISGIANLDTFEAAKGEYDTMHNLIRMKDNQVNIDIVYPYLTQGLMLSLSGLIGLIALVLSQQKSRSKYIIRKNSEEESL